MSIVMIFVLFLITKECSPNHGVIFKRLKFGWHHLCSQNSTNHTWIDAAAGEIKGFGFLASCLSEPSCKGVQATRHGTGYYRLERFPTTLTNIKDCEILYKYGICMANLSSWGYNDMGAGRNDSLIEILGGQKFTQLKMGVNTVEFDPISCSIKKAQNFDVFLYSSQAFALRDYLKSLDNGTIVLGITFDEPTNNLGVILDYLASVNLNVSSVKFRGKFTFAWQKGFPEKTILATKNGVIPLSTLVAFTREANSSTSMAWIRV